MGVIGNIDKVVVFNFVCIDVVDIEVLIVVVIIGGEEVGVGIV